MSFNDQFLTEQADPNNLISVVQRQSASLQQLGQSYVRVQSLDEIAEEIGRLAYRAIDANGRLRMIMSAINLINELSVDAHFAGIDASGVVQFYVNADNGKLYSGGGTVILTNDGILISAGDETDPSYVQWKLTGGDRTGFIASFEAADDSASGIVLAGQKSTAAAKGLVYLNVYNGSGTLLAQLMLDTLQTAELRQYINVGGVTQRNSRLPANGWQAYALPDGVNNSDNFGASSGALVANGGSLAHPITIHAPMLLQSVSVWNNNTASARTWNWYLYEQQKNTGSSAENTLDLIAYGAAQETFTPGAASLRTIAATSAPVYLAPGTYWLVVQNQHASNTFDWGRMTAVTSLGNVNQAKTLSVPLGSTLDFVAATWTKGTGTYGFRLDGRVFGETSAF